MTTANGRTSLAAITLPLGGVLTVASTILRGPFIDFNTQPRAFAEAAAHGFVTAGALGLAGIAFIALSWLVLYGHLSTGVGERAAWWGFALNLVSIVLLLAGQILFTIANGWLTLSLRKAESAPG